MRLLRVWFTVAGALLGLIIASLKNPLTPADDPVVIPHDFKLTATDAVPDYSWETTITAGGDVLQIWRSPENWERTGDPEARTRSKLTAKEFEKLVVKVREADLFGLPTRLSEGNEDAPWYCLSVTMGGTTHETYSGRPSCAGERERRFYRVSSEVLRRVPSPFPGQEASRYDPDARCEARDGRPGLGPADKGQVRVFLDA